MRQIPNSPPPHRGATEPIIRLTVLGVYLFYPYFFPSQINPIPIPPPPPQKKKKFKQPECLLKKCDKVTSTEE